MKRDFVHPSSCDLLASPSHQLCGALSIFQEADEHKLMDCLIENKNSNEMNAKCRAGINHHQIVGEIYLFNLLITSGN